MGSFFRLTAWILIFSLTMQPILGLAPNVFAADAPKKAPPKKKAPGKKAPSKAPKKADSKAKAPAKADSKSKDASATPEVSRKVLDKAKEEDKSGQKFLTQIAGQNKDLDETERAKAKQVASELSKQANLYTEDLDILGPDDSSPVLAESVFGQKGKQRINLIADDIQVKALMDKLASEFKLNLVSKAVAGTQKLKASLYDLPLETVFHVLLEQANLTFEKKSGIIYLQDRGGKTGDAFLSERFFKLKPYADAAFARQLIENIATTKGKQILEHKIEKTFYVVEYTRNLEKIQKVLSELGYLEELDPDAATLYYHYLSFNYVDSSVVKDIVDKYRSKDGKASLDEKSNRYLVFDTKQRFEMMKAALSFVDVPRGQVFIDVIFVDLSQSDSKRLGVDTVVDWKPDEPANADQLVTTLATDVTNFFSLKQPSHLNNVKITGINEHSNSNILNNPRLMVLNNEKAIIDVTEKFPYVINENNNGVISSKIQNVDIGVKLEVEPRINGNAEVRMKVKPTITVLKEVKNIVTKVVDTNQANARVTETSSEFPITDERSIDTNVVVPTGRTLVIGGLIKETDRKSADSIPGLSKLPILGKLFKRKSNGEDKSELYIFITPTIVRNAPKSSVFDASAGDERLAFFPLKPEHEKPVEEDSGKLVLELVESESQDKTSGEDPLMSESDQSKIKIAKARGMEESELVARPAQREKVDFASFIKKIAALKQKERLASLQKSEETIEKERKEKAFDNLIDQLKEDIKDEESTYVDTMEETRKKAEVDRKKEEEKRRAETALKKKEVKDTVMQERAARISNLLDMWEQSPVDGILADEDLRKAREEERKERERRALEKQKAEEEAKRKAEIQLRQAQSDSEEGQGQQEQTLIEEKIIMDTASPLDAGNLKQRKMLKPGTFSTGELPLKELGSKKSSSKSSTKSSKTKSSGSAKTKKKPRRRPRKKAPKKVSYLEPPKVENQIGASFLKARNKERAMSSIGFNVSLPKRTASKPEPVQKPKEIFAQFARKTGVVESEEVVVVPSVKSRQEKVVSSKKQEASKGLTGWEKDFFEKDLARVVFSEVQLEELEKERKAGPSPKIRMKPLRSVAKQKVAPVKKETHSHGLDFKSLVGENIQSPVKTSQAVKAPARKVKIQSTDPRTQAIFNQLTGNKAQSVPRVVGSRANSKPRSKDGSKKKVGEEREFENFLDQMFSNAGPATVPKASGKQKKSTQNKVKPKEVKPAKKDNVESEFLEFLEEL